MKRPAEFLSQKGLSHTYPIIGFKYDGNLLNLLIDFNEYQEFDQLQTRIKELETTIENNVTELIHRTGDLTHDFWYFCAECLENFEMDNGFNYCPNCGRKIVR